MKKLLIAVAVAAIASVPAVTGLVGNASFAQSVRVQVPAGARTLDDSGRHVVPRDDRGRHAEPSDDRGKRVEPGDDRGEVSGPGLVTARHGGSRHGGHDDGSAGR